MKLLGLALRNLFRNTRRTVITAAAVAVGLSMMVLTITLQEGSYADMISQGVSQLAGHVVVQGKGFQASKDSDIVVTAVSDIETQIAKDFPDAVIAPRTFLGGLINSPSNSVAAALQGIDPDAEAQVQDLPRKIVDGTWLAQDDTRGILIGATMAETLAVGIGDKIVYMGQHSGGTDVDSRLFRVRGIFQTGAKEVDGFVTYAHIAATEELQAQDDVATMITVHLRDPKQASQAADLLRAQLARDDLEVLSWSQALPEIYGMIQVDRSSGDLMLAILGLIVALGVLNTMLMSVLERTREFGVMLAVGLRPATLLRLVLYEGLFLGLIGTAAGLLLGGALSWYLIRNGLDYSQFMGESFTMGGIALSSVVYGKFSLYRTAIYAVGSVLFTTAAALYPAIHVARLQPVDAIHHV